MFRCASLLLFFTLILFANQPKNEITIGIISFRDLDENNKRWEPLKKLLEERIPNTTITLLSFHQKDLDSHIAQKKIDFMILHPQAFVEMEIKYGIQNIASLVRKDPIGNRSTSYAGTIATLADSKISTLSDLRGKKIAIANKSGQAIYLMPKELLWNEGIDIDTECTLVAVGQPLLRSYEALRDKKVDVAFFRSGYLEELFAQGIVKSHELKIINQQTNNEFHYLHSTPLYPEWSFAAAATTPHPLIKEITFALYSIHNAPSPEFDSFSTPLSYKSTRELMQKHAIYPFNTKQTIKEFLDDHFEIVFGILLLLILMSWGVLWYYFRASKKLTAQANQIKNILATASDGIHIHDRKGKIILFSDSFCEMLGYTRGEFKDFSIYDIDHFVDPKKIQESLEGLTNGITHKIETKHTKKDGKLLDVEIVAKVIEIDGEQFIYASSRDLTSVRNHEKILKEQNKELETIFNATKDGLAIIDHTTRFLRVNKSYSTITGLTQEELLQTSCLELTTPEDRFDSTKRIEDLLRDGAIDDFEKDCVIGTRHLSVNMSMALLPDRKILIGVRDISKQKSFEEQTKLASMGEMIGNIAHQWRQPLSVISALASGIQFRYEYNQLEDYNLPLAMENIMQQTEYLSKTIDDFRNFIKDGHEKKLISLKETIEKTTSLLHPAMKNNNIHLIIEYKADIEILGYENELIQSFINIVNNAKDAIKEHVSNDDDRLIFITTDHHQEGIVLSFVDSGGGIESALITKIFEPYFTTKHQSVGTGIGLSMTRTILTEHHNASITVSNKEYTYNNKNYKGICFEIIFKAPLSPETF